MKRRIFIAFLPSEVAREELVKMSNSFRKPNVRLVPAENLHFTIVFIGWIEEEVLLRINTLIRRTVLNYPPFSVKLTSIICGPNSKRPRMIWAAGERNKILYRLYNDIKHIFSLNRIPFDDRHLFRLHLTLARAKKRTLIKEKIDVKIDVSFLVDELLLMESKLNRQGVEYKCLKSFPFSKT